MFERKSSGTCKSEELYDQLLNSIKKEFGGGGQEVYEVDLTEEQVEYYRQKCTLYENHFAKREYPIYPGDDATLKKRGEYWEKEFLKYGVDLFYSPRRLEEAKNFPELKDLVELAESMGEYQKGLEVDLTNGG